LCTWHPKKPAAKDVVIKLLKDMVDYFRMAFDDDSARTLLRAEHSLRASSASKPLSKEERMKGVTDALTVEMAQKALSAKIVALLSCDEKNTSEESYFDSIDAKALLLVCVKQISHGKEAREFWDDVENTDLRMLVLVAPREWIGDDVAKLLDETDPGKMVETIAAESPQRPVRSIRSMPMCASGSGFCTMGINICRATARMRRICASTGNRCCQPCNPPSCPG
jgi:hypothetical protein